MKKKNNIRKKVSLAVIATFVAGGLVFADAAKNCITDVSLNSEGGNVKVNIYTNKPYTDSVVVSKKEGNRYVLLVPETSSSLKSAPKITNSGGNKLSVSMQTVSAGKGYTKIVITSDKTIKIVPRTLLSQQQSAASPTQQTTKPAGSQTKVANNTQAAKPAQKQQTTQSKPVQPKTVSAQKPKATTMVKKPTTQSAKPKTVKNTVPAKPQAKSQPKPQVKPQARPVSQAQAPKKVSPAPVSKPKTVSSIEDRNKPLEVLKEQVKTDKIPEIKDSKADALLEKTIKENDKRISKRKVKKRKNERVNAVINDKNVSTKDGFKLVFGKAHQFSFWKLLLLSSAIAFPLIVIMIILGLDKRINRRIMLLKKGEEDVNETNKVLSESVMEVIAKKEAESSQSDDFEDAGVIQEQEAQVLQAEPYSTFEEMLDKAEAVVESERQEEELVSKIAQAHDELQDTVDEDDFIPDNLEEPEDETLEVEETMPEQTPVSPVIDEVAEDDDVVLDEADTSPETELDPTVVADAQVEEDVAQVEEVVQVDEAEDAQVVEDEIASPVPFNPDGVLADFSGVNDSDFFDELVLRTHASDIESLPENNPADELLTFANEDESGMLLSDFESDISGVEAKKPQAPQEAQTVEETPPEEEVTMLNEAKINDKTGLYLVNYDNFSSLVGHIADDYFVIKKFDGVVKGNIILKQAEKNKKATKYLVRVGTNKMIVEVSDNSMSRLIDL